MPYQDYWQTMGDKKYQKLREELRRYALSKEAFPGLEIVREIVGDINDETYEIWRFFRSQHKLWNVE